MASIRKAILQINSLVIISKRFRGKINIQKPRPPHFEKQLLLDFTKPFYRPPTKSVPVITLCNREVSKNRNKEIDNPFERILARECLEWFNTSKMVIFLHLNSISMEDKLPVFANLKRNNMHLRTYGKKIVGMATNGTRYEAVNHLFNSHQNIIFGQPENIGKLFKMLKKTPQMIVIAGIIQDRLMSKNELVEFSKLPSLDMARSQLCNVLQSAGSTLAAQLQLAPQTLVAQLDQHVTINTTETKPEETKPEDTQPEDTQPKEGSQS